MYIIFLIFVQLLNIFINYYCFNNNFTFIPLNEEKLDKLKIDFINLKLHVFKKTN